MVKCPHANKGEACFEREFKNSTMLKQHIIFKHPDAAAPAQDDNSEEEETTLTKRDLGLEDRKDPPQKQLYCSECGHDLTGKETECPNCGDSFE